MTNEDLQAALDTATATLATRELRCWEGEYSPAHDEYARAHARAVAQLRDPAGPLAPLLAVLAQTERERDEARALAALVTAYRAAEAAHLSAQRDLRAMLARDPRHAQPALRRAEAAQRAMLDAIEAIGGPPDVSESSAQCVEIRAKKVPRG